jgi:Tfp pilus assembly protein PilF
LPAASPLAAQAPAAKKDEPAKGVDKAKLRDLIPMPQALYSFQFNTEDFEHREPDGRKKDFAKEAEKLRARLDGSARDAEVYRDLAECYRLRGQEPKRLEAARKAEELLRPLLPKLDDARLLAAYCEVLTITAPSDKKTREKWARRATEIGPKEWRAWVQFGSARFSQFCNAASGQDNYQIPTGASRNVLADLARLKPTPAALEAAEKCIQDSRACYDKVRQLAPHDAEARRACYVEEFGLKQLEAVLAVLRGKPPEQRLTRDATVVADAFALARLCPGHAGWQVNAIMWEIAVGEQAARTQLPGGFRPLNPEDRKRAQKYLDRLAKAAENKDDAAAAFCGRYLASMYMRLGEPEAAARYARQALKRDPALAQMAELYAICLDAHGSPAEAIAAAQAWVKLAPGTRAHLVLARGLARSGKLDEAEKALRDALALAPSEPYCTLGLAAVLMRKSNKANTLIEVGELLQRGQAELALGGPLELLGILPGLMVINEGLSDRPDQARELLGRYCAPGQENDFARQVRHALGS